MADMNIPVMAVFQVREVREAGGGTIFLDGFWFGPGEGTRGALMWSCKVRPPESGSILGVSRKAEMLKDRKTQQPEPNRRRITDPGQLVLIHEPEPAPYGDDGEDRAGSDGSFPF